MLNYIWIALIFLGFVTAIFTDISDSSADKFRNSIPFKTTINFSEEVDAIKAGKYSVRIQVDRSYFDQFYNEDISSNIDIPAEINFSKESNSGFISLKINESSPALWKEMAASIGDKEDLTGTVIIKKQITPNLFNAEIVFESISFMKMKEITNSVISYAGTAVTIALGLIGIMALWLGIMKIADDAGLIKIIANTMRPITKKLFPEIPSEHPAMSSMIMNISANMLGLGNAATPFGLKAMEEMESINPNKGTASNSMVTFLAINTAGFTLIPATAIAVRAASGSSNPAIIIGTTIFGALCATIAGVTAAKIFEKFYLKSWNFGLWMKKNLKFLFSVLIFIVAVIILSMTGILYEAGKLFSFISADSFKNIIQLISNLAIPVIIVTFVLYGFIRKVKVYESFVEGARTSPATSGTTGTATASGTPASRA